MRRGAAVLAGLTLVLLVAPAPGAEAVGAGACTITGTIRFTPTATTPDRGTWNIAPAVIQCQGIFNVFGAAGNGVGFGEKINGNGQSFTGSGSYLTVPSGDGGCLHELGRGEVDYWILTDKQDVHMREANQFLLAGAGTFTTPTLYGSFQIPLFEGDCLAGSATTGLFLAEVTMARSSGYWP